MSELKPCPFCGGEAQILEQTMFDAVFFGVKCVICGAEAAAKNTEAEAIALWNKRAAKPCYATDRTHESCKYSINRGWVEDFELWN